MLFHTTFEEFPRWLYSAKVHRESRICVDTFEEEWEIQGLPEELGM